MDYLKSDKRIKELQSIINHFSEPIEGQDERLLRNRIERLKKSGGVGKAIGELAERMTNYVYA